MKKNFLLLMLLLIAVVSIKAQDKSLYEKWWFIQTGDTLPYRLLLPENYDPQKSYPVVFFLHGRGESGTDNEKQLVHGSSLFLRDSIRKQHPAIVVFPQCPNTSYWSNVQQTIQGSIRGGKRTFDFMAEGDPSVPMKLLVNLVDHILKKYLVERDQVYVMGLSMGGMGTFELVRRMPNTFAAAIPICGGADPATAKKMRKTDWWIFHGLKDDIVDPQFSKNMEAALKDKGAYVKATYFPNANHNSWDPTFAQPGLMDWLFSRRR